MRSLLLLLPLLLAPAAAAADTPAEAAPTPGLSARIELRGPYYRVGEPVEVRVVIENLGTTPVPNASGVPIIASLTLESAKGPEPAAALPTFDLATQPRMFAPGSSHLQVVDLAPHFASLHSAGTYKLRLKAGALESDAVDLVLAPPYDPGLDYRATLKTDLGDLVFDLLEDVAPDHVRNFVDLSRRGFYDNTKFFLIAKGELIAGGDPVGDGSGSPGYSVAPELSTLPHERGTLCSARSGAFGSAEHGSQFMIELRRRPDWDGNFTIFARLVEGEQTLAALEGVTTSGKNVKPFFHPLKDTLLRSVTVEGRPRTPPAAAPPSPPNG
jgi:peptidyl-prolyl cis-trans isomerase B (cyclophilin B)